MSVNIKKYALTLCISLSCGSCSADVARDAPVETESFSRTEKVSDPASPVGYWVIDKRYPLFSDSDKDAPMASELNNRLQEVVERYQCDSGGDESFEAVVHTLEDDLLSLSYTAMWTCKSMPSPDSTEGSTTIALPSLKPVDLKAQFIDQERYEEFSSQIRSLHSRKMEEKGKREDCPFPQWEYFTVEPDSISFYFEASTHYPSECAAKIQIRRAELTKMLVSGSPLSL